MTEHTHSRAKPTESELDKTRSRLSGHTQPNASGATADILPTSTASLAARLKPVELTDEQKLAAEHNRKNRAAIRAAAIDAQRQAAKKNTPPAPAKDAAPAPADPVNGEDEDDFETFTAGMTAEQKEQFKKDWDAQGAEEPAEPSEELSDDELLGRDAPPADSSQATGEG